MKFKAQFNDRGYENAKSFASRLLAYSLWLIVLLRQLQAINLHFPTSGAKARNKLVKHSQNQCYRNTPQKTGSRRLADKPGFVADKKCLV